MGYHFADIKVFRDKNAAKAVDIPLSAVKLVEKIHKKKPEGILAGHSEPLILVRKCRAGFALVTGWRDYWRAKQKGAETIKAIRVYQKDRHEFIGAFKRRINIDEINIPSCFVEHPPSDNKVKNVIRYYKRNGVWDKPIILGKGNILKDGYARYLAAVQMGLEEVPYIR